jgi:hypothetical protein
VAFGKRINENWKLGNKWTRAEHPEGGIISSGIQSSIFWRKPTSRRNIHLPFSGSKISQKKYSQKFSSVSTELNDVKPQATDFFFFLFRDNVVGR